jgi:hypothetical protein
MRGDYEAKIVDSSSILREHRIGLLVGIDCDSIENVPQAQFYVLRRRQQERQL